MSDKTPTTKEKVPPAVRMTPSEDLKVNARTLGTKLGFDIPVANISRSGMLLEWPNAKLPLPFIENTLIEMELSAILKGQPRRVQCMGKVVRRTKDTGSSFYGVRVIHTDDQDQMEWVTLISGFEKTLAQF
jgi:hypothetical protein